MKKNQLLSYLWLIILSTILAVVNGFPLSIILNFDCFFGSFFCCIFGKFKIKKEFLIKLFNFLPHMDHFHRRPVIRLIFREQLYLL